MYSITCSLSYTRGFGVKTYAHLSYYYYEDEVISFDPYLKLLLVWRIKRNDFLYLLIYLEKLMLLFWHKTSISLMAKQSFHMRKKKSFCFSLKHHSRQIFQLFLVLFPVYHCYDSSDPWTGCGGWPLPG